MFNTSLKLVHHRRIRFSIYQCCLRAWWYVRACIRNLVLFSPIHPLSYFSFSWFISHSCFAFTHCSCLALTDLSCAAPVYRSHGRATFIHHSCVAFVDYFMCHTSPPFMCRTHPSSISRIHAMRSFFVHASYSSIVHGLHSFSGHALYHRPITCRTHSQFRFQTLSSEFLWSSLLIDMYQVLDRLGKSTPLRSGWVHEQTYI